MMMLLLSYYRWQRHQSPRRRRRRRQRHYVNFKFDTTLVSQLKINLTNDVTDININEVLLMLLFFPFLLLKP